MTTFDAVTIWIIRIGGGWIAYRCFIAEEYTTAALMVVGSAILATSVWAARNRRAQP